MSKAGLDQNYVCDLVLQAQEGEGNAFAELFAATYPEQYAFARAYLGDDFLAQQALQSTYVFALKNMGKLREPMLFLVWLNQINLRKCMRLKSEHAEGSTGIDVENADVNISGDIYPVRTVLNLPFTEAQVLLLRYFCKMRPRAIAPLLGIHCGEVRQYVRKGRAHLQLFALPQGGATQ